LHAKDTEAFGAQRIVANVRSRLAASFGQPLISGSTMVGLLFIAIVWQHPIARLIGTETTLPAPPLIASPAIPAVVAVAPGIGSGGRAWNQANHGKSRDPFQALVAADGSVQHPVLIRLRATNHSSAARSLQHNPVNPTPTARGAHPAGCQVTHVVRAGESLWSISAAQSGTTRPRTVAPAWRALYAANRAAVGPNPSYLEVGTRLCLPTS
jgi:nucleoid-associated protein YgaU